MLRDHAIPKPIYRSPLRLKLGKVWFINKRRLSWYLTNTKYATHRQNENLHHIHAMHGTPMLRKLSGVDMNLQINKKASLEIAASCIDGLILKPGETFSFWRMVGKPTSKRGFKIGLVLRNGTITQDVGGGLCQMTNLIYWMTIHTDLKIVERWRHGFHVFPDAGRTQPFASGATCSYNYIDLQIINPTQSTYQLRLSTKMVGCMAPGAAMRNSIIFLKFLKKITQLSKNIGAAIRAITASGAGACIFRQTKFSAKNSSPTITPS